MPTRCTSFVLRSARLEEEDYDLARLARVEKTRQRRESDMDAAKPSRVRRGTSSGALMRPLAIELFDEVIELRLLLQQVVGGGFGGFFLQRQVHAFVPAVLLRMSWLDALDVDSQT